MNKTFELIEQLKEERNNKIQTIRNEYQNKIYQTLLDSWNLQEGITKLRYISDRDGYIEGIFKGLSKDLRITIQSYSCNGSKCDGETAASYLSFINRW